MAIKASLMSNKFMHGQRKKTMTGRINVIFCFMHMNSLYGRGYENGCSTEVLLPVFLIHTNNEHDYQ